MFKRLIDFGVAITVLFVLAPLLGCIAFIIYLTDGRPVIFSQDRVGHKGFIFRMYKFRTMRAIRAGENIHHIDRLTRVGKILRSLSFDELPGLFNIVLGNMSLVGPRPLLVEYLDRYSPSQMRRHDVMPGLTGWAQVNGRNTLSWDSKFKFDVWYVDHQSLFLDIKIIFMTLGVLFFKKNINASNSEIMEEFDPGIYVLGAGGHAKVVLTTLEAMGLRVTGVFDDNPQTHGTFVRGIRVLGSFDEMKNYKIKKAVIAIGSNEVRKRLASIYNFNWMTVIHPDSKIHSSVKIGVGSVVFAGSIIQAEATIGEHCIVNTASIVEHDCIIENFSHLCPGVKLGGGVHVGQNCLLGIGCSVIPYIIIGEYSTVGAGAVVTKSIEAQSLAVGVPATIKRTVSQQ